MRTPADDLFLLNLGVTAEEVHQRREETGEGLQTCYHKLRLERLREGIRHAHNIEDLKAAMLRLMETM